MQVLRVKIPGRSYDVKVASGVLARAGDELKKLYRSPRRVFIVTSPRIYRLWGKPLEMSLRADGFSSAVVYLPEGERHKTLANVEQLAVKLVRAGADRESVVLAFGGGVVGDCAGLLASLYMRGIDCVQIPTTLLAQIDASIGGKTGVNLAAGKNLLGTFWQPRLVLADIDTLSTTSDREFRSGMYEALKCGIIGDPKLFQLIERSSQSNDMHVARIGHAAITEIVSRSISLKAKIVSQDERESGLRRWLNLGHTIGHALEADTGYRYYLHGEAVAWGIMIATRLASAMNLIDLPSAQRIVRAVAGIGPLPLLTSRGKSILRLMHSDKKTTRQLLHLVLPTRIGAVAVTNDVPETLIVGLLDQLRNEPAAA